MPEKIEFEISGFIAKLLRDACRAHSYDQAGFAKILFLKGLAALFGSMNDDVTKGNIEEIIEEVKEQNGES